MTAPDVLNAVQIAGGSLTLKGERISYILPGAKAWLVEELKAHKGELVVLLGGRKPPMPMPPGVRLLEWKPKDPPVAIVHVGIVTDVTKFVESTLMQLKARLEGKDFLASNWSKRELIERLEQVGVEVTVEGGDK